MFFQELFRKVLECRLVPIHGSFERVIIDRSDVRLLLLHRHLSYLDIYLLLELPPKLIWRWVLLGRCCDDHFSSASEIGLLREKPIDGNIDVREVFVARLAPQRCACNVTGAPAPRNKIIDELVGHFDSVCPIFSYGRNRQQTILKWASTSQLDL